ncbi:MAG: iron ABC transporter permease [Clostridia bacterium]|nr:iron ABC transporter permease [Clostridia bacterium]
MKRETRWKHPLLWLIALWILLFVISFGMGRYPVPLEEVGRIFLSRLLPGMEKTWTSAMEAAVLNIRLPRVLLACLVGCCLSAAGAAYQGVFQNPMASPDLLGASSGAAFGAALAILLGASSLGVTFSAFGASIGVILLVNLVAARAHGKKVVNLILAGVMVSSLCSAGTSYIKLVADPANQLPAITYWMMGSLSGSSLQDIRLVLLPMALGLVPLFCLRWRLNLLTLGDDEARAMGVNAPLLRLIVVLSATLMTAASVSVSGLIGWIGLVAPHLSRKMVGNDYRKLLPTSMLMGACFLLAADNVSRNLAATEIPIGILTAFIGTPFFLYLIMRKESLV